MFQDFFEHLAMFSIFETFPHSLRHFHIHFEILSSGIKY